MAMEAVNGAMTYQAQPTVEKPSAKPVNKEVPVDKNTANVDAVAATAASVTPIKARDEQRDGSGNGDKGGDNEQQQALSDQLKKKVAEINKKFGNGNVEAVFGIHEKTNRITIKIMDKETKEVVKEYPPEKTLDMIAKVWEMAGILVDEKL